MSIIMPVFNAEQTLVRAVNSIRAQTFREWELYAFDDGSTDRSLDLLFELMGEDSRIIVSTQAHHGIVHALNASIASTRGEFIARMDADDECFPERLAEQVAFLDAPENRGVGLVSCLVEYGGDRKTNEGYARHVDWVNSISTPEQIALRRFVESPLVHPSVMFRREVVDRHGAYREGDFPEDYELWLRWLGFDVKMAKVPRTLLRWNDSPARLSRTDARYKADTFFELKAPWLALWAKLKRMRREIWIWGAGRPTRKRAQHLSEKVEISGYIDVDPKKIMAAMGGTGKPVISPEGLPAPGKIFVFVYVSSRGAREQITDQLTERGYVEGDDFLLCA